MSKRNWTTWATRAYTHDVANDQRSAGGVHLHQVRKIDGQWQARILQSNGKYRHHGEVSPLDDAEGEARYATAVKR